MIRHALPTLAALALLLSAGPALAQPDTERNLYETAREMWERELSPNTRAELQPRWAEIEALKERLATLESSLAQNDPRRAALEALIAKQHAARTQGSGTLRGTHGGAPGTDGRSIGLRNFERADALISQWAREGKPMTVERLQEINRVLGTGLQHNGRPPGTIRANAGENITAGGRFHYVPGRYVGEAMQQFTQWYEASKAAGMPPAELAGKAYMRLVSIHPFWDANGRSTRMLMDWVLRSHGLPSVALQDVMVAVFGQRPVAGVPAEKAVSEVTKALEQTLRDRLAVIEGNGQGFATRRAGSGPLQPSKIPAAEVQALFSALKAAGAERLVERISAAEGAERVALALSKPALERLTLEIVPTNDILAEQKGERVRISTGLLNEIHARGAEVPAALRGEARARVLGLILGHEIAHAGGIKAERAADAEALRVLERAQVAGPILRADLRNALGVFSKPTGLSSLDRLLGRLSDLYRYGTPGGRLAALERAARGEADRLASYRRADGTLRWKALAGDGLLREGGALAHFTLALFLKELAMVVRTGDRLRIEEFFDGVLTTDFFKHYGLFALGARGGELFYGRYLAQHLRQGFVSSLLKTHVVLMTGLALPQIVSGEFEGKTFMISVASLGLSTTAVRGGMAGIKWVADLALPRNASLVARMGPASRKLLRAGGWLYTAAELAVVLYVADDLTRIYSEWEDGRAAKKGLSEEIRRFLAAWGRPDATPEELQAALARHEQAWIAYRDFLYRPFHQNDALLQQRLQKLAKDAHQASLAQEGIRDRIEDHAALAARARARAGSTEAYAEELSERAVAALQRDAELALAAYERGRAAAHKEVYGEWRRERKLLGEDPARRWRWSLLGGLDESPRAPMAGKDHWIARRTRAGSRHAFRDKLKALSPNRLQSYEDELELLAALDEVLALESGSESRRGLLAGSKERVEAIHAADRALMLGQGE